MDALEGQVEVLGTPLNKASSKNGEPRESTAWNYEQFRQYLIRLTEGRGALLPVDQYPDKIELSEDWLKVISKMRVDSQDGKERHALVGYRPGGGIILQTLPSQGLSDTVPREVVKEAIKRAREKAGVIGILGTIHSHAVKRLQQRNWWKLRMEDKRHNAVFSTEDLYGLLIAEQFSPFEAVVQGNDMLFAFQSRETQGLGMPSVAFPQHVFTAYWHQQFAHDRDMNIEIARRHNLVFYNRAYPGNDLKRVYSTIGPKGN